MQGAATYMHSCAAADVGTANFSWAAHHVLGNVVLTADLAQLA